MSGDGESPAFRREAARWLARHDRGLTGAEQDAFHQWLAADPRHGEWFARHRRGWDRLDGLAAWQPQHGAEPNPDVLAQTARRAWWLRPAPLAAAAALVLLAGGLAWKQFSPPTSAHAPATAAQAGGYERRVLDDGSVVELTGGAELDVNFTPQERRVALRRGEALFTVAKNPARPFIVSATGVEVRAVGTAFSVGLGGTAVEVLVTHGRVAVGPAATAPAFVDAGQRAHVADTGARPEVSAVSTAEMAQALAWRAPQIEFSRTPLAEAMALINAHLSPGQRRIVADPGATRLRDLRLSGFLAADNAEGFLLLLESTFGVTADRTGSEVIVLRSGR